MTRAKKKSVDRAGYGVTKQELLQQTRALVEEAYAVDPYGTDERIRAAIGRDIFSWDRITTREISALRRAIYSTVLGNRAGSDDYIYFNITTGAGPSVESTD